MAGWERHRLRDGRTTGVSFRHAFEVLADGRWRALSRAGRPKYGTARTLPSPVAFEADDYTATRQVLDYLSRAAEAYAGGAGLLAKAWN